MNYSTIEKTDGITIYLIAFPDFSGIETMNNLTMWEDESITLSGEFRQLIIVSNLKEANATAKSIKKIN
jgi:hypothetical protein